MKEFLIEQIIIELNIFDSFIFKYFLITKYNDDIEDKETIDRLNYLLKTLSSINSKLDI